MAEPVQAAATEAVQTGGALARGFGDLFLPKNLLVLIVSVGLSIALAVALWYLLRWALLGGNLGWGWLNWIARNLGRFGLIAALFLLFPAILNVVTACFLDIVVNAVEKKHYPDLPKPRHQPFGEIALYIAKFTSLVLLVNVVALPITLLLVLFTVTAPFAFLFAWLINGYLFGREYYELVAMRRLTLPEMHAFRRERVGGRVFRTGFWLAALKTVPVLNLVMPVVAAATFTHAFHALPWRERAPRALGGTR